MFSPYQLSSDCKNYPPEGTAFNEITQSLSRFGQRERLCHDRFDRTGLEERHNCVPRVCNGRLRLTKHIETPDAGLWHDEICHVNGCLTACGIPQRCEASSQRERLERLAQDFTADPIDHNICAVAVGDTTYPVTQLLQRSIDDLIESEGLRLFGFRVVGRARYRVFCFQSASQLCHRVTDRPSDRWSQNGFTWTKTSQRKSHLRGEIRDRNARGAYVIGAVRHPA